MIQLITDIRHDPIRLEQVVRNAGAYHQVLLLPTGKRELALVRFTAWDRRKMDNVINELVVDSDDPAATRIALEAKIVEV